MDLVWESAPGLGARKYGDLEGARGGIILRTFLLQAHRTLTLLRASANQSLGVPLAFASLAVVEGSGLRWTAQAGKRQLVEDPLEGLVSSPHPAVVTHPLARVTGRSCCAEGTAVSA
jgi:hypothetical protein